MVTLTRSSLRLFLPPTPAGHLIAVLVVALGAVASPVGKAPSEAPQANAAEHTEAVDWPIPIGLAPERAELRFKGGQGEPMAVATPIGLVVDKPGVSPGFVLFSNGSTGTFLLDTAGQVAHQWRHALVNARLLPNGNVIGTQGDYLYEMDRQSQPAWEYKPPLPMHHDYLKLPNGNVLVLLTRRRSAEEVIAAGANPEFVHPERGLAVDEVVEVKPTYPIGGEIVWEWSVWDHLIQDFDPARDNHGDVAAHPERVDLNYALAELSRTKRIPENTEWAYFNALDYRADLDQVLISARNFGEIWVLDHGITREEAAGPKGDLLYRWGNPRAHRAGTAAEQQLFWPHSAHWIPAGLPGAGNILVFSNGDEFEGFERGHSEVVEFEYPLVDSKPPRPARGKGFAPRRPTWRYVGEPPGSFYSKRTSSVQRLANGNTFVLAGMQGTMFEVTPGGETIWQYVSPLDAAMALAQGDPMPILSRRGHLVWANMLFRVRKYAPDHAGLEGLDLAPKGIIERGQGQPALRVTGETFEEPVGAVPR